MSAALPLVSVIIPTYNRAKILPATLASVLGQSYPAIEAIVVDDGSSDNTAEVVAALGPRVRYVRQANQGVEAARNRGIRESRGEFLNFLDDDDLMLPEKIARQVALFQQRPELGLVHCRYHYIDQAGAIMETSGPLPEGDVRQQLAWGCFPWSGGPLVRRECLEQIGEHEHRDWFGDWGMWLRVALAGYPFGCVQEPLGCYRIVAGSMTDDKVANCERLVFHILGEIFSRWEMPAAAVAERDKIYAGWHFWLSCRYYLGGYWDDGRRNLAEALRLRPDLLAQPQELLQLFYWDAISPRVQVHDPIRFINGVFDHLPEAATPIAGLRGRLLAQISAGLALRSYGAGRVAEGRQQLAAAIGLDPALLESPDTLLKSVYEFAYSQPGQEPMAYVETVLRNLPPEAASLGGLRAKALSEASLAGAFQDYAAGRRRSVPGRVISAARYQPSVLKNRGVISIFVRSLPALLGGAR